jgi:hypothetical protein
MAPGPLYFGLCGDAEGKKTEKFVFRSALRPNQISFSHNQDPNQTLLSPDLTRCSLAVALLVWCWSARSCRRCLRLGLRGHGLRRGDGNAVEPPLVANHLEHEIEIDLLGPCRDVAAEMQHSALIERGHGGELRCEQSGAVEIEIASPQIGKTARDRRQCCAPGNRALRDRAAPCSCLSGWHH